MWDQQAKARTCSCWLVAVSDRAEGLQQVPGALEGEGQGNYAPGYGISKHGIQFNLASSPASLRSLLVRAVTWGIT